ncbi:class I SAM-dependent methyltransferase [Streptomyces armeniacus]|uniref:Class I SAM-dependent methyltransferase n=1 Tax=Streptomyces armeniacus TaxID=83291 RepID=A0A345XRX0_9ACTN|nr:class I SAM-dependent methyltransferase [Streptomyces armeniacus]AXK34386.1 class I SAM-dependent methyltransferase [Streptomyces armeniacus]
MISPEQDNWDAYAEGTAKRADATLPTVHWTQYENHGPGAELIDSARRVLDLGFGSGAAVAALCRAGVDAEGVDLSPVAGKLAAERWPDVDSARFVLAEASDFLAHTDNTYDALISYFGAMWFTDPQRLLPPAYERLAPGGRLVFAQPPPIPGCYGPQGMYKGGFAGKATYVRRWCYTPETWKVLLEHHGFTRIEAREVVAPNPGHIATLLVQARKPNQ